MLSNKEGFSANQRVFGRNINLPSVLTDELPALEPTQSSDVVRKNLEAMHAARQNFIKAESSEKIRRAMRHKVRSYADHRFENGEKVYYRRRKFKGWKGPATVIGEEGKVVLIRHGSAYYRCHPCHLMKKLCRKTNKADKEENAVDSRGKEQNTKVSRATASTDGFRAAGIIQESNEGMSNSNEELSEDIENQSNSEADDVSEQVDDVVRADEGIENPGNSGNEAGSKIQSNSIRPKRNTRVEYEVNGRQVHAKVLSQQPKRNGKNGNWLNVHVDGDDDPSSVNWDDVSEWKEVEAEEEFALLTSAEQLSQEVVDAKEREIVNLIENDVFDEVNDDGQPRVSCKWVVTSKVKDDKNVVKARLVARGFEEKTNSARTDSPTCSRQSLRMAFVTASTMKWQIQSLDITSAFLQGNSIERNVFLKPPPEANSNGKIWKLKRCIYGLNDAPRAWYDRVSTELMRLGGKASLYDDAMFLWYEIDCTNIIGLIVTHVDDFIYVGTSQWHEEVINHVMQKFRISAHAVGTFRYVGLNVKQTSEGIFVDQQAYVQELKPIELKPERMQCKDDLLSSEEKSQLRSLSGQLLWATSQTRPDGAYYSCVVSNYGKEPTVRDILSANKAVKTIKSRDVRLFFPCLGDPKKIGVISFSDASHANLPSGASQGGFIVFLCGNNKVLPFMWQSKKLNRVTKSPLASETMELADAADAGHLAAVIVKEDFGLVDEPPVKCYTDSQSLIDHLQTSHVIQDSRLRVDVARIREMIQLSECNVEWIEKECQLADPLTKAGASPSKLLEVLKTGQL